MNALKSRRSLQTAWRALLIFDSVCSLAGPNGGYEAEDFDWEIVEYEGSGGHAYIA